jgi:signal transduction histidine kinase
LYFGNQVAYTLVLLAELRYLAHYSSLQQMMQKPYVIEFLGIFTIGLFFVVTMAQAMVTEKSSRARAEHLLAELETSHQQLQVYSEEVADLATARERNRLARDIHDSLGHYLTVINVQLEKALAFRKNKPEESDQAMRDAKRLASEALQDVRRSVSALRTTRELPDFRTMLQELVERMRTMQYHIDVRIEGGEEAFAKPRLLVLYQVLQESFTNVQKHAEARKIEVHILFEAQEARLTVRDDGQGFQLAILQQLGPGREGRYGLQGIQERLESIGGTLSVQSAPGEGTQLTVNMPRDFQISIPQLSL